MKTCKLKKNKGVAGLEILVSLIATLFVIGVLVMAFTIAGSKMADTVGDDTTTAINNETITMTPTGLKTLTYNVYPGVSCSIRYVTEELNSSAGGVISTGNWTVGGDGNCGLTFGGTAETNDEVYNNTDWNVSYSATYSDDLDAVNVINETKIAIAGVTDWFDTFIVIGAVVVLVLLIVLVIMAIRRAGLMGGAGA